MPYFYPRPPRGGRHLNGSFLVVHLNFYPRPPRGGRRGLLWCIRATLIFLSTPSARRATCTSARASSASANFYPRPPRGGRRCSPAGRRGQCRFLSTPSARRATFCAFLTIRILTHFYPRPPRGGRLAPTLIRPDQYHISIHALREEGDPAWERQKQPRYLFLSTPSARRATIPQWRASTFHN